MCGVPESRLQISEGLSLEVKVDTVYVTQELKSMGEITGNKIWAQSTEELTSIAASRERVSSLSLGMCKQMQGDYLLKILQSRLHLQMGGSSGTQVSNKVRA